MPSRAPADGEEGRPVAPPILRLFLDVDYDRSAWTGHVELDGIDGPGEISLDAEGIHVTQVRRGTSPLKFEHDREHSRLAIPDPGTGPAALRVDFSGRVTPNALIGLYRSSEVKGDVLTTQCEPNGARRIFPCFDRPDRKAIVELTVRTRSDLEVVSNTAVSARREVDGGTEWTFEPSPPMPTYLFYLGVGRFEGIEDRDGRVPVRAIGPPGRSDACRFAVDAARRILDAYEAYYGIPYPLSKLDLVAVREHAFGAMENWGAISFREMRMLIDRDSTPYLERETFATIAHEIAHQWFGNLVTMRSWDDVWLNESFASLAETRISQQLAPAYDPQTEFFLRIAGTSAAFDADALRSTHPVRARVDRPEEISQVFDEISYGKGSTVLAMFESFLGDGPFRAGVTNYLRQFRFGNARTEDLWDALGRASGQPVGSLIAPWIDRPGHPVVWATQQEGHVRLHQTRFSLLGAEAEDPWPIPMVVSVGDETRQLLFRERETTVPVPSRALVHLNRGATGFYRVRYDAPLYERLFEQGRALTPPDRWSVVEDLGAFLFSGDADWPLVARAVEAFGQTTDRLVVESLLGTLGSIAFYLPPIPTIDRTARTFCADRLAEVGLEARPGESAGTGIVRERVASMLVRLDLPFAQELAPRFARWDVVPPTLRNAVALAVGRVEGASGWRALHLALERSTSEAESLHFERGLAWSTEPDRIDATLALVANRKINRGHVVSTLLQATMNPLGRPRVGPWLREHLPDLAERFRGTSFLSMLLEHSTGPIGLAEPDVTRAYFADHAFPEGARGLGKGLERLTVLERLYERLREA